VRPRIVWALTIFAGIIAALGQAPFDLWPVAVVGFGLLYALMRSSNSTWVAALTGWLAGCGYFVLTLNWIVEPFMVDVARDGWMAPFALVLISAGMALFWGGGFALARLLGGGALAWIGAMAGVEMARSYVLTGFPWGLIGHSLIASPLVQWAAVVGAHGLSLLVLLMAVALWRLTQPRPWMALPLVAGLAVLAGLGWQMAQQDVPGRADGAVVRLVQPNAPQQEKWDPDKSAEFFRRALVATSAEPAAGAVRPDLIIWPETSVPTLLEWADDALSAIAIRAGGTPVVVGIQRRDDLRLYNSAVLVGDNGQVQALYDKHHLVPFGEYLPFGDFLARFGITAFAAQFGHGYTAGPGARLMDLGTLGQALPLICYEAVFAQDVAAAPSRPAFLLQITNDAWFGAFSGPYQHLAQTRLRAIEQGLGLVRAANTGVSAVIDARGHVVASLGLGQQGYIDAPLPGALPATLYSRTGDLPLALGLIGLMIGLRWRVRRATNREAL
jgi:apolipoprotein N-acyltransferase